MHSVLRLHSKESTQNKDITIREYDLIINTLIIGYARDIENKLFQNTIPFEIYNICSTFYSPEHLLKCWIYGYGSILMNKYQNNYKNLINSLFTLYDTSKKIIHDKFHNSSESHQCLTEGFTSIMDRNEYLSSALSKYSNDLLQTSDTKLLMNETTVIQQVSDKMDYIVQFYSFIIKNRDFFENYFTEYLAQRLLKDLLYCEDLERLMITKLKTESGYHWTKRLEDITME
eukprot:90106_1